MKYAFWRLIVVFIMICVASKQFLTAMMVDAEQVYIDISASESYV